MRNPSRKAVAVLTEFYRGLFEDYIDDTRCRRTGAGLCERQMVDRHLQDMTRLDGLWVFRPELGYRALVWMSANLRFPDGAKRGRALKLEAWQVFILMMIFGWVDSKTGTRRYLDAYIEVARKNGKSTLMGAVLDYMAFSTQESCSGSSCYIAATTLDQAGECFKRACKEIAHHQGVKIQNSKNNKVLSLGEQEITAIAATPLDGKMSHCLIVDEYHQHVSDDLIDSVASGNMSDPESLVLRITTAGTNLQSPCKKVHDLALQVLEGSLPMDRYFFAVFCPDEGDSEADMRTWRKANPNWSVSVQPSNFKARYDYCRTSESAMIDFKTKNLNLWVNSLARWANMRLWREMCCEAFNPEDHFSGTCYAGLDLSSVSDFTAYALDSLEDDGNHYLSFHFWVPEDRVSDLERQLVVPLRQWIADGYITATPGPVIDYSWVAAVIEDSISEHDVQLIAADRYQLTSLAQLMPHWFQDKAIEFSQGMKSMSPSISEFERLYKLGMIHSGGNPVVTWMMSCCESSQDVNGNVKLVKPSRDRSKARIDGVIAMIMAVDTAITQTRSAIGSEMLSSAISFV